MARAAGPQQGSQKSTRFAMPERHPVTAELIAEHASVQPGGKTRVGVRFEIEDGWHIYAQDPGDAGLPTSVQWWLPLNGAVPGSLRIPHNPPGFQPLPWPKPLEFRDPGDIKTFGYSSSVVIASVLWIDPQQKPERTISIEADVKWLACKEICLPGKAHLSLDLPVSPEPPALSTHAQFFQQTDYTD